jgi:hypothetical protein
MPMRYTCAFVALLVARICAAEKAEKKEKDEESSKPTPIQHVIFTKDGDEHFAEISFSRDVCIHKATIMEAKRGGDVNSYTAIKQINDDSGKTVKDTQVSLGAIDTNKKNHQYCIHVFTESDGTYHSTEAFVYSKKEGKFVLLRNYDDSFDWGSHLWWILPSLALLLGGVTLYMYRKSFLKQRNFD